jgi:hypothetical protein
LSKKVGITLHKQAILDNAQSHAIAAERKRTAAQKDALTAFLKVLDKDARHVGERALTRKLTKHGMACLKGKRKPFSMPQAANKLMTSQYATTTHLYFGVAVVPFQHILSRVAGVVFKAEEKKVMQAAALNGALDGIAQQAAKTTLRDEVIKVAKKKAKSLAAEAASGAAQQAMKCNKNVGVANIKKLSEAARAEIGNSLKVLEQPYAKKKGPHVFDPPGYPFPGLVGALRSDIFKAAKLAARHSAATAEKTSMKAAKEVAKKSFNKLAHDVSRRALHAAGHIKVAQLSEGMVHKKLVKKATKAAVQRAAKDMRRKCMAMVGNATQEVVEQEGVKLKVRNPKVMEASHAAMMKDSWKLVGGDKFLKPVNKEVVKRATKIAGPVVLKVATAACANHTAMEPAVMAAGLKEMNTDISKHVDLIAERELEKTKPKLRTAAVAIFKQLMSKKKKKVKKKRL